MEVSSATANEKSRTEKSDSSPNETLSNHPPGEVITDAATVFASPLPLTGERKVTTRKELWSWYLFYMGNSGLGPFNFAISAWQNLLYLAGWDPAFPRGTVACGDGGESSLHIHPVTMTHVQQAVISLRLAPNDPVRTDSKDTSSAYINSQLDRIDHKRTFIRVPSCHLLARWQFCGLRGMETAYYYSIYGPHMGGEFWLVGSGSAFEVSLNLFASVYSS